MSLLDARALADMRAAQADAFWDSCVLLYHSISQGETGQAVPSWPTASEAIACRLVPQGGREQRMKGNVFVTVDARLRLPLGTAIDMRDRIRITHRHGEALDTPQEYDIVGYPEEGASAITIGLHEATL